MEEANEKREISKARAGFEPATNGFANRLGQAESLGGIRFNHSHLSSDFAIRRHVLPIGKLS